MKIVEFGSEFDWLSNDPFITKFNNNFLAGNNAQKYRSGRDALKAVAIAYLKRTNKVLLPALCCESMVLPFTMNGYQPIFYKMNSDYTANVADIEGKIEENCIFLYMSFFGIVPLGQAKLEEWRKRYNAVIIEDRTQNALNNKDNQSFVPDITITSIRKWLAIPDGGLLWSKEKIDVNLRRNDNFANIRKDAMLKKSKYLESGEENLKGEYLYALQKASMILDENNLPYAMSTQSEQILDQIDFEKILTQRQNNVYELEKMLRSLVKQNKISFVSQKPQDSALYFPILVSDRDALQKKLAEQKIYCPVIWPVPQQAVGVCDVAEYTAKHILALPCDQRYNANDMRHIARTIIKLLK